MNAPCTSVTQLFSQAHIPEDQSRHFFRALAQLPHPEQAHVLAVFEQNKDLLAQAILLFNAKQQAMEAKDVIKIKDIFRQQLEELNVDIKQ